MKPVYYKKNGVVNKVAGVSVPIPYPADDVSYDNTTSQLEATDVQSAIDELSQKEAGVQSDWNESDSTKLDYIKNKPTIPAAQIQSDWSQSDNTQLDFIKNKPSNLVQDASYVHTDNNYTSTEKTKLGTIAEGAEVNVQSDWNQTNTDADDFIKNKPTIPDAQIQSDWNQTSGTAKDFIKNKPTLGTASALDVATSGDASSSQVVKGDDSRLTDARTPVSHTHTLSEITDAGTAAAKDSTSSVTAGSTDLVESGAVKTAIDNAVSGAYKHAGTKTCAELISNLLIASNNGNVYNITDSGTTTSDFIEGAGIPIRAGDNVGIAKISDSIYKFDLLSGFIDTSNFVNKSSTSGLIKNDGSIDTTEYAPASSIPAAQIQSDWSQSDNTKLDYIKNKPTLGTAAAKNIPSTGDASTSEVVLGNDSRLTDARNAADVYEWAKASTKPSYIKSEVGLGNVDNTSDSTKKSNFTGSIASENTGFVTGGDAYTALNGKVDKVDGKGLSSNDYTDTEKNKLAGIASGAEVNVQSDWNQTNTSSDDYIKNKPTNLVQDASYVHTDNNYTSTEKNKLAGIASGAEVNVQSDWNQTTTSADDYIKNKPTKLSQFTNDSGFTKVESSTTNGNIKIDTVETQVYDDSEIQNLVDTSLTETDYANPLSLTTDNTQNAVDTKIKLEPIQDLHGYDKPWTGGAGKNLMHLTVDNIKATNTGGTWNGNVYTINDVTITLLTDLDNNIIGIKVNGTASSNVNFVLSVYNKYLANGNYKLNGCPAGGSTSGTTYYLGFYIQGKSAYNFGNGDTNISIDGTEATGANVFIHAHANYNCQNLIFYPMIRLSTESDSTFKPYTNISSISGHDQINVLGCGKNWFGAGKYLDLSTSSVEENGDEIKVISKTSGQYKAANFEYDILPSQWQKRIYVSCESATSSSTNDWRINVRTSEDGINFIEKINIIGTLSTQTMLIPNNTVKLRILFYSTSAIAGNVGDYAVYKKFQLEFNEEGSTEYELPAKSNNKTIVLPDTVYGGVLDLESGKLVVDKVTIDLGNLAWSMTTVTDTSTSGQYRLQADLSNLKPAESVSIKGNMICSAYENVPATATWNKIVGISATTSARIYLYDINYNTSSSASAFTTFITGQTLCYELATPITIQLTPSQLYLLKNQNNLTTSQYTQIKVIYRNGVFALLDPATETTDGLMSAMDKLKLDGIDSENISLDLLSHAIVLQRT